MTENAPNIILKNAKQLIEEAQLLFEEREYYARAAALAQLSTEESSRALMIFQGETDENKLHSHLVKTDRIIKLLQGMEPLGKEALKKLPDSPAKELLKSVFEESVKVVKKHDAKRILNKAKQAGLYAHETKEGWKTPQDIITINLASQALMLAQTSHELVRRVVNGDFTPPDDK